MEVSFKILGPLDVTVDGQPTRLGGALRERTLVMLLLEPDRVVPVARLVEAAWDDAPPASGSHQVRKAVAELRQRIPHGPDVVRTDGPGYRATVTEEQLDLLQYRHRLRRAREALGAGQQDRATSELQAALELWRGPVMAGTGGPVIGAASAALEEQHLGAVEQLFDLRLAAGEGREVIADLRMLAHRHPMRENLRGQLMHALYQTGRQAEALDEYRQVRDLLSEELGIDPSAKLSELYSSILRQSPDLAGGNEATLAGQRVDGTPGSGHPASSVPHNLPYDLHDFSGRAEELTWIDDASARAHGHYAQIIAIDGMGGSGKTTLAVRAAYQLAARYPDGQIFVDLCGFTPGQDPLGTAAAVELLLAVTGVSGEEMPGTRAARIALWHSITQQRRMVVVLDNAADTAQVRPLIPTSPGCLSIVTSRPRLVDLDGAELLSLQVLSEQDGMDLLHRVLGEERTAAETAAAAELITLCGHLPLAIRIAAGRLRNRASWTVQRLVERLRNETRRLEELSSDSRSLAGMLQLSYQSMTPEQRRCLRLLGLHPGRTVDTEEAAALFGTSLEAAEDLLEPLLGAHLLEEQKPGWYGFHDLVRSFVQGLAEQDTAADDAQAIQRLLDHYVVTAERAGDLAFPERFRYGDFVPDGRSLQPGLRDQKDGLRWLDLHRDNLLAAVELAYRHGLLRHAAYLPRELGFHSDVRNYPRESYEALTVAVAASRDLDDPGLVRLNLTNLAMEQWGLGLFPQGIASLEEALELARSLGDRHSEVACVSRLGQMYHALGELRTARRITEEAAELERELGLDRERGASLTVLSSANVWLGQFRAAVDAAEEAVAVFERIGERRLPAITSCYLALALAGLGRLHDAVERLGRARAMCAQLGGSVDTGFVLAHSADMWVRVGELTEARHCAHAALDKLGRGDTSVRSAAVHNAIGRVYLALGEPDRARDHHSRAREIAAGMAFRYEQAQALDGLATAGARLDDDAAARLRQEAEELYARMGVPDPVRRLFQVSV